MEINVEDIDVLKVEDVCDLGNGEPLFANFTYEDWAFSACGTSFICFCIPSNVISTMLTVQASRKPTSPSTTIGTSKIRSQ